MVSFYTPWKHQKTSSFVIFSGGIDRDHPANISTLFQCCLLVDTTSRHGTTSNQCWNNAMYFNVGILTTSNNIESTLCISMLIWTTLDNIETMLSFSMSSFTTLVNVETMLWKHPFPKRIKKIQIKSSNRMHEIESFNYYLIIFFTLLPMLRGTCKRVLAKPQSSYKIMKNNALQELNLKRLVL